jgi:dihydroflavonol-4-reductase
MKRKVAVTGATGHVGNVLVRELIRDGYDVRAVILKGENRDMLNDVPCTFAEADVRDAASLRLAFQGIEGVFHLAGIIAITPGKDALLEAVNVKGTANVIQACRENGVERLLYTSSIHAVHEPPSGVVIDETQPFDIRSVSGAYGKSKARATKLVLSAVQEGLDAVIVCPTGIIGPFDYRLSQMGRMIRDFLARRFPFYIDGSYDFVDVRDVVRGMIMAFEKGGRGESYILSGEKISVRNLFLEMEKITGIRAPKRKLPSWIADIASVFIEFFSRMRGREALLCPESLQILRSNSVVDCAKASRELGYSHRSVVLTIRDTVGWVRDHLRGF